jgi:hypothetical protein
MGDPELRNDEKVLVRTPGVYVKSIPFEGILTNKRVILVDRAKNLLPPKEIPLATVKDVETGENAIRDQILTLSVMGKTGEVRQMILTFSRQEGGNRIKERDEWARQVRANVGSSFENVIRHVIPGSDATPRRAEPAPSPRISVVNTQYQPAPEQPSPAYREPEGIHPIKKIIDAGASSAVREFDASTLGQTVFCSRCGNKVPGDSAFCNRCGSPVVVPGAAPAPAPQPVNPGIALPVPSLRPIDRDIQTIEPLIARSTEKIPADPLRKSIPDVPLSQSFAWDDEAEPSSDPVAAPAIDGSASVSSAEQPEKKGFFPRLFSTKARTQRSPAPVPAAAPPVPEKPRRSIGFTPSRNLLLGIGAIVVILVIVAIGVVFVYPMLTSGTPSGGPGTSIIPSPTSSVVKPSGTFVVPTESAVVIPPTGIYVHVYYLGGFKGSYGMPGMLTTVPGNSLDYIREVENANGTVTASFEKTDGSAHELLVEIYKNGALLTKGTTTIGHGSVVLSVDTDTGVAATPITSGGGSAAVSATTAAAVNTTAKSAVNATATTKPAANTTATAVPAATLTTVKTTAPAANTTASP